MTKNQYNLRKIRKSWQVCSKPTGYHFLMRWKMKTQIYASKKTESQVDMKEAKRMTLFNIMINVSRNGIKDIMKNDPIKYLQKQDESVGFKAHHQIWLSPCYYLRPSATLDLFFFTIYYPFLHFYIFMRSYYLTTGLCLLFVYTKC